MSSEQLIAIFATAIRHEVDPFALGRVTLKQEIGAPFTSPLRAILADADEIFIDPDTRPGFVELLQRLIAKHN